MNEKKTNDHLPMEYEQTVQTLRNWDTLFFNTFSSIIIAGGVGGLVIAGESEEFKYLTESIIGVLTALYLVFFFYYLYNVLIAAKKFTVLREIEDKLGLVGTYKEHKSSISKYVKYLLLPIFTLFYVVSVAAAVYFLK